MYQKLLPYDSLTATQFQVWCMITSLCSSEILSYKLFRRYHRRRIMALSRIGYLNDAVLTRFAQTGLYSFLEARSERHGYKIEPDRVNNLHLTAKRCYPNAPVLPLPSNVSEIFGNETGRFTPERARDISGPVLIYGSSTICKGGEAKAFAIEGNKSFSSQKDCHVDSYDCSGAVSLNSSMQSNVPKPFSSTGKSTHFNMPGGQWAKDGKYIAEDMQKSHYASTKPRLQQSKNNFKGCGNNAFSVVIPTPSLYRQNYIVTMAYSTGGTTSPLNENKKTANESNKPEASPESMSLRDKLKRAVKDYGSTVIVFHVCISLASLGVCYLAVSSGIDMPALIQRIGLSGGSLEKAMSNSSTFLIAYGVHKCFAPLRISLTLGVTPFLVRYLRKINVLKIPKS